jgi:hypothetical protein
MDALSRTTRTPAGPAVVDRDLPSMP